MEGAAPYLAAVVRTYRDLQAAAQGPAQGEHWLFDRLAVAACEAGLVLLQKSAEGGSSASAYEEQLRTLGLSPEELVVAANQRLQGLNRALGEDTLSQEAAEVLYLQARALRWAKGSEDAEAKELRRRALRIALPLLSPEPADLRADDALEQVLRKLVE
ncbi:unnamed protein product [Effrenium voratum]|nr:unnamed protein product [Effrenium voratum]